jgi:hypothetical protein
MGTAKILLLAEQVPSLTMSKVQTKRWAPELFSATVSCSKTGAIRGFG